MKMVRAQLLSLGSIMLALAAAVAAAPLLAACGDDAPAAPPGYKTYESPALDYTVAIPSGWELYLHHKLTRTDYFGPAGQQFRTDPPLSIRYTPDSAINIEALIGAPNTEERIVAGQRAVVYRIEGERDQRFAHLL